MGAPSGRPESVLLLDGGAMATLAFARSLGRAGVRVSVAADSASAPALRSRYCSRPLLCPSPLEAAPAFREWLMAEVGTGAHGVVVGCTDHTLPLLQEWRTEIEKHAQLPLPPAEAFRIAFNKEATLKLAGELGIPVPEAHRLGGVADLEKLAARGRWPVVIKPRSSVLGHAGKRSAATVAYAFDAEELRTKYAAAQQLDPQALVQDYVAGTGVGCFFLFHQGRVLARFQHQRIRDKNPLGSGSCLRVSVPPDARLMEWSEKLLRGMGWDGLAMVEYRVGLGGEAWLMEVNPRPWGSMQLAIAAGVDFPLLWWRAVTGVAQEHNGQYRMGLQCRYLAGDFQHLESVMLGPPRGWRLEYPRRWQTLLEFLKFFGGDLCYDDFAAGDWWPGFAGLANYFRGFAGRVGRRIFGGGTRETMDGGAAERGPAKAGPYKGGSAGARG